MGYGVGGINGANSAAQMAQEMRGTQRPNREQFAEKLFSKLDTSGQGFIEIAGLQAAASQTKPVEKAAANIEALFQKLDADLDGKLTLQEFTAGLKSAALGKPAADSENTAASSQAEMHGKGGARQIMSLLNAYGLNAKPAPTIEIAA